MQAAIRLAAQVQPGGKIEIVDAQLPVGIAVEVDCCIALCTCQAIAIAHSSTG